AKMAECTAADCCGNVDALRDAAQAKNKSYNDLVTAHGPHKNETKEAKTYLGMWSMVPPLYSAAMFIYTKLRKTQKSVEALALWRAGVVKLVESSPRDVMMPAAYTVFPKSPKHVLGAAGSMHVYGAKDLLVTSETMMIYGTGVMVDPVANAQVPDPSKGKVAIVGGEEVRVTSKGEVEVAADDKVLITADHADFLADQDVKVTAPLHTVAAQMNPRLGTTDLAKLVLQAAAGLGTAEVSTDGAQSLKLSQRKPAKTSEIAAVTPGTVKIDAGAKINIEAQDEIKLSLKNGGPSLTMTASGIVLKVGPSAQVLVKQDQVILKFGNTVICRLAADQAQLKWGASHVVLNAQGGDIAGPIIREG
ncbi:MAG: hypothetical protein R3F14_46340, partial [Polyangiaceae bacterium]